MMYSLYQYALGKDTIEIEVNSFLLWLIPLCAVSFRDSYAKILEGWYRREHIHSTMQIHTRRPGDAHSTSPRSGAKIGILVFISGTLSFFGEIYPVSVCRAEPEDWCQSTEALQWYDTRNHLVTGNRDIERDSCQRLEPVYQWLAKTQGPPRHAHMHIISISVE